MDKQEVLKNYFGHAGFREGQEQIVDSLAAGRDVLCVMPTGAGKSICYQVPALLADGITLVVSPLISLMKDQVESLIQSGVPAAYVNSSLTPGQSRLALERAAAGRYKIIYVAPERLTTEAFLRFARSAAIDLVAVDEAHCVSQWGQDFRPSYLKIADFMESLDRRPTVGAFTATATRVVKEDIASILGLRDPLTVTTGFDRRNLYFSVEHPDNKLAALRRIVEEAPGQCGIVYCATRKNVEQVCDSLCGWGVSASRYHAGLSDLERRQNQEDFLYDRKTVMVATNAFGMGIDKSNVSYVVHYNMPKDMESYYQEAGRAGRDGEPARCTILYSGQDVRTNAFLIDRAAPNPELDEAAQAAVRERDRERLRRMTFYCTTADCLRAYILRYFGETAPDFCGACSNCEEGAQVVDAALDGQKVLSCVARMNQRFGIKMVIDVLRGSKNERIQRLGMDRLSTYGLLADSSEKYLRAVINALLAEGYAALTEGDYPVLTLTERSQSLLRGEAGLTVRLPAERKKKDAPLSADLDEYLFARLKALRADLAAGARVPAYVVFTDACLRDMCRKLPRTPAEFLEVSGVGRAKLERYGAIFLREIEDYLYGKNGSDAE